MKSWFYISVVLFSSTGAYAKDCQVEHYNFVFGSDASASMTVKSGARCTSTINARSAITSSVIAQQAASGTAMVLDSHRWGYQSRKGFQGHDAFVVALVGQGSSNKFGRQNAGETKISVDVNVVP